MTGHSYNLNLLAKLMVLLEQIHLDIVAIAEVILLQLSDEQVSSLDRVAPRPSPLSSGRSY